MSAPSVNAVAAPPTPWIVGPYDSVWSGIVRNDSGKWDEASPGSAIIVVGSASPEVRNLCAAAPDMLAVLKDARFAIEATDVCLRTWNEGRGGPANVAGILERIDASIAKAEGRS